MNDVNGLSRKFDADNNSSFVGQTFWWPVQGPGPARLTRFTGPRVYWIVLVYVRFITGHAQWVLSVASNGERVKKQRII